MRRPCIGMKVFRVDRDLPPRPQVSQTLFTKTGSPNNPGDARPRMSSDGAGPKSKRDNCNVLIWSHCPHCSGRRRVNSDRDMEANLK